MDLSDADRRAVLVHLEQIRAILRGPVGAEPPMAGDIVEVAESYGEAARMLSPREVLEQYQRTGSVSREATVDDVVDTDGGVAQQAAATASRGIYAGSWCRYGTACPHPNVCQLAPGGCTDRRDVFRPRPLTMEEQREDYINDQASGVYDE